MELRVIHGPLRRKYSRRLHGLVAVGVVNKVEEQRLSGNSFEGRLNIF